MFKYVVAVLVLFIPLYIQSVPALLIYYSALFVIACSYVAFINISVAAHNKKGSCGTSANSSTTPASKQASAD